MVDNILSGVKVVELSTYVAGPVLARVLGDWGADVVKVEGYHGDPVRQLGINLMSPTEDEENPVFFFGNANKRCIALNQREDEGREIMNKLLMEADVFVTNTRSEALESMGIDYDTLKEKNPRLIFAHILGYGKKGPIANRPAFDFTTYFARSGFMDAIADKAGSPTVNAPGFGDIQLAMFLVAGIAGALYKREKTGKGDYVDVSLYHVGIFDFGLLLASEPYESLYPWTRTEPLSPLVNSYRCKDGEWYYLGTPDFITYWEPTCKALGMPELIDDPKYNNIFAMLENRSEIREIFDKKFAEKTCREWEEIFQEADIPSERVFDFQDVLKDEQAWANDFFVELEYENGNSGPLVTTPVNFNSVDRPTMKLPGGVGCDTEEIMKELGYNDEKIATMKEQRIVNY